MQPPNSGRFQKIPTAGTSTRSMEQICVCKDPAVNVIRDALPYVLQLQCNRAFRDLFDLPSCMFIFAISIAVWRKASTGFAL
jgi:hypothetical protein